MRVIITAAYILIFLGITNLSLAQKKEFTRQDSLRGSITPEREWWDLNYYHLDVKVNPQQKSMEGSVLVMYTVLKEQNIMQIDLQHPMKIHNITQDGRAQDFTREGNAYFIELSEKQKKGSVKELQINYGGKPKISPHPPWEGAITWEKDGNRNPFIATSYQGDGASMVWPCKDHMYDEPDSMLISVTTPGHLMNVSNGRLRGMDLNDDGSKTWHWFVSNPISNYVVNINIGDYVHFGEVFNGETGDLDCDYYVLRENLNKAKKHFKQVPGMLEAFEHWFGPYPFYKDSYKLVEVPYAGMEHQSSVTYGNGYKNGFGSRDLSRTEWGKKFDFIIIHESGHEWFANNITYADIADMWIHESFTNYSEGLYVEYHYGKEAGAEYIRGLRSGIMNDRPIIGEYDVNYAGSGDMYYKGANMLHTIRQIIDDDNKWRAILRGLNREFRHQTVRTEQIESYMEDHTGFRLKKIFDQYLRDTHIPTLEYRFFPNKLEYRWTNCVEGFDMPVKVWMGEKEVWLKPKTNWKTLKKPVSMSLIIDKDFYVAGFKNTL